MLKTLILLVTILAASGCGLSQPRFKETFITEEKLQEAQLKSLSKDSPDVIRFASSLYSKPGLLKENEFFKAESIITDRLPSYLNKLDTWETNIYKLYCAEKGGEIFYWYVTRAKQGAFSGFRGYGKEFFTCEKAGAIESALLQATYRRDSQTLPYEIQVSFASPDFLKWTLEDSKLNGYISNNSILAFPSTIFSDHYYGDPIYSVLFDYTNNTQGPVEIDILKSKISIDGISYDLAFDKTDKGIDRVEWNYYNTVELFVASGNRLTKLHFNPGQRLHGEFRFKIPGKKLTVEDLKKLKFNLDGIECKDFKYFSFYDKYKNHISERRKIR